MSFLLDTDICSAHLRGDRSVFARFTQYSGRLHVSVITAGELYSWVLRSKAPPHRLQLLQRFFVGVTLVPIEYEAASRFGVLRAALLDQGKPTMSTDPILFGTIVA